MSTATIRCGSCGYPLTVVPTHTLQHRQCPNCRSVIPIPPAKLDSPAAVTLPAAGPVAPAVVDNTVAADETEETPRTYGLEFTLAVFVVVILALAIGIVLVWRRQQSQLVNSAELTVVEAETTRGNDDAGQTWTNAEQKSLAMNDVVVSIPGVQYGQVRGRDGEKYVVVNNQNLLQIRLKITNFQVAPRKYRSWYTSQYLQDGVTSQALLIDDRGNTFPPHVIRTQELYRHTAQAELHRHQSVEDLLIFKLPPESEPDRVKYYRLKLPAAAYGRYGVYRFEIPRAMVEREESLTP
jgi:hypothetical protein